jgi:twitching motility protein PilT
MQLYQLIDEQFSDNDVSDLHIGVGAIPRRRKASSIEAVEGWSSVEDTQFDDFVSLHAFKGLKSAQVLAERGDSDFACTVGEHRVRGNLYIADGKARLALRRLDKQARRLDTLGLPSDITQLFDASGGMVLVVGGTGSGKSTTLGGVIQHVNSTIAGHIITLESPIEIQHKSDKCLVHQRSVGFNGDVKTFAAGLKSAMREDPDVLLIGEINDRETVEAAVKAAQTGHLVLATLHTNNASETVERLLSFYSEAEQPLARSVIAATLRGVIAQKLVRGRHGKNVMVCEVLRVVPAIRSAILDGNTNGIRQTMNTGTQAGQLTFNRSLLAAVKAGSLTQEAALRESFDANELKGWF